MSRITTRRFAAATTLTAILTFALLVPTVLHLANPAFGQAAGSGNGYTAIVNVETGTQIEVSSPVGSVRVGQNVSLVLNLPPPAFPLEPTAADGSLARNDFFTTLFEQPKVMGVRIESAVESEAVEIRVQEFVPTDAALLDVVPSAPTTGVADVILRVATPATGGTGATATTSYRALKILEISAPGIPKGGVAAATITFRVLDAEMTELGLLAEDIQLLHHVDGQWVPLETRFVSQEEGAYVFEADTPSFSYFAVAAKEPVVQSVGSTGVTGLAMLAAVLALAVAGSVVAFVILHRKRQS